MASGAPSTTANTGVPPVDDWLADTGGGATVAATPFEPEFADGVAASLAGAVPDLRAR